MTTTVRCGNCDYWLGESSTPLVRIEVVAKGEDVALAPPRDLRLCKGCGRVNVFVATKDLDVLRARAVA
jgi:hypothetical protein